MEPGGIEPPSSGCEPGALPLELRSQVVLEEGFEPPADRPSTGCSSTLSYSRTMYRARVELASEVWKTPTSPPMLPVRVVVPTGGIEPPFPG